MRYVSLIVLCAWLFVACAAHPRTSTTPPTVPKTDPPVSVSVYPKFALGTSMVRITVRLAESKENRALRITLDGPFYQRSSLEDWSDGLVLSPKILTVSYDDVPEGNYLVTCILLHFNGQTYQANDTLCIGGMNTDCTKDNAGR